MSINPIYYSYFIDNHVLRNSKILGHRGSLLQQTYYCEDDWLNAIGFNMAHLLNYCGLLFLCCDCLWLFVISCLTMYCIMLYPWIWNKRRKLKFHHPYTIWWKKDLCVVLLVMFVFNINFFFGWHFGLFPFTLKRNMKEKKLTILFPSC